MDNTILGIFGRKGSGKTTLTKRVLGEFPRALVLDALGEYEELAGAVVCRTLREAFFHLGRVADLPSWRVVVSSLETEAYLSLLRVAWELERAVIVVEEAHAYGSPWRPSPEVSRLVRLGRHRGLSSVFVSQRPHDVPRIVTSQADVIVALQQHEEADVRFLKSIFGKKAELLRELPKYEAIVFGDAEKIPTEVLAVSWRRGLTVVEGAG